MSGGTDFFERLNDRTGIPAFLEALKWDADGLITVVSQDVRSRDVLGVAFADRVAIQKSLDTGLMHYYSRSRKKLWLKGEESGHFQKLVELRVDCDGDAILARVRQVKGNCHLGYHSCFSYRVTTNKRNIWSVKEDAKKIFNPEKVYKKKLK